MPRQCDCKARFCIFNITERILRLYKKQYCHSVLSKLLLLLDEQCGGWQEILDISETKVKNVNLRQHQLQR